MAQVDTTAITTLSEVKRALLRSDAADELAEEVFTDGGDYDEEGVDGIEDASGQVRNYLHRDLFVQQWTPLLAEEDFQRVKRTPDPDYDHELKLHRIPDWPVLSVSEDVKVHDRRRIYAKRADHNSLTVWAGYRRSDLGAQDYGVDSELNDSEIPEYPDEIVQVAKRLSIYYAVQKIKGLIGVSSERQTLGEWQTEMQSVTYDSNYPNKQLKKVHSFRSLG